MGTIICTTSLVYLFDHRISLSLLNYSRQPPLSKMMTSSVSRAMMTTSSSSSSSSNQRRGLRVVNRAAPTGNERRAMESARVAARTNFIASSEELDAALTLAGNNLVMLGLISEEACEGFSDAQAKECRQITSSMARIARECPDVTFLECDVLSSTGA